MYFTQWDADKYENIGIMLLDNYCQAGDIIADGTRELDELLAHLRVTREDLDTYIIDQRETFGKLDTEPEIDVLRACYVGLLQDKYLIE